MTAAAAPGGPRDRLRPGTAARVDRAVALAQRQWHSPGVSVGLVRDGLLVHSVHVGSARLDPPVAAGDDTAYMIGSVTKTFTAVLVMRLRDAGALELDDPLERFLPGVAHGRLTVRRMLSHLSGLQREAVGRVWETLDNPDRDRLLADLHQAEAVLPPQEVFHYSNLAYALLGQVVERVSARPWAEVLRDRLLVPLGLTRTGLQPEGDHAVGYAIHPYTRVATQEPVFDSGVTAPLGGLWSCVTDLLRYADFIAEPDAAVLAASTVEEMCRPIVMTDLASWRGAYGLGFGMERRGDRVYVGHGGAMPGFLTGLMVSRPDRLGAVVSANSSTTAECVDLAAELLTTVLDAMPTAPTPWAPEAPQDALAELAGLWWTEGSPLELFVEQGRLSAMLGERGMTSVTRFVAEGPDRYRAVEGRERGELFLVERTPEGTVSRATFATYAVTREPTAFHDLGGSA